MYNKLNIFIAGAKELSEERSCIKEVANDLSSSTGVHVVAISYEQLDDKQATYNKYIEETADIVIFVIDRTLGSRTEDEFSIATNSYKNQHHPEVFVFLRKFKDEEVTPQMAIERARIEGLIKGRFDDGKYYIDYTKDDGESDHNKRLKDLKIQAEQRISRHIAKLKDETKGDANINASSHKTDIDMDAKGKKKLNAYRAALGLVAIALVGSLVWHTRPNSPPTLPKRSFAGKSFYQRDTTPLLIFAGGGSVRNFLHLQFDSLDVRRYPHSINIGLASGSSWRLLSEEYQSIDLDIPTENKFITICLSASKMSDTFYKEHISSTENVSIAEVFLGYDTLSVGISVDLLNMMGMTDDTAISSKALDALITKILNEKNARIFTTNKTSGTLNAYINCLADINSKLDLEGLIDNENNKEKTCYIFYDNSEPSDINTGYNDKGITKPYVILGSQYYYVKQMPRQSYRRLLLTDGEGKFVKKPMYLYFLSYHEGTEPSKDYYTIREPIAKFLDSIKNKIPVSDTVQWEETIRQKMIVNHLDDSVTGKIVSLNPQD